MIPISCRYEYINKLKYVNNLNLLDYINTVTPITDIQF